MTKKLWKFYADFGRMGELEGLFIMEKEHIENIIGESVYFGEVLGKHSDIVLNMQEDHFTEIDLDEDAVNKLHDALGSNDISGYNPFHFWERADA